MENEKKLKQPKLLKISQKRVNKNPKNNEETDREKMYKIMVSKHFDNFIELHMDRILTLKQKFDNVHGESIQLHTSLYDKANLLISYKLEKNEIYDIIKEIFDTYQEIENNKCNLNMIIHQIMEISKLDIIDE